MDIGEPRRLGSYVLEHPLGRGGMGEVWKARHETLGRTVALKLLTGHQPEDLARFRREAALAARLSHPNIGALYEFCEADGSPFIAMQYIEGVSLDKAGLTVRQAAEAVKAAAEAVEYAHTQGIVHRDLKPANMMVDSGGRVYVMDFGLAKGARIADDTQGSLSMSGAVLGTPAYMSPEQAQARSRDVGPRSDVYGLGATLYALTTGRSPFVGDNVMIILRDVIAGEPLAPRKLAPHAPREVETIVLKAMDKDSARRYESAQALADDLGRFLSGDPIQARPVSLIHRLWKRVRKQPVAWGLAATLALVLPTAAVLLGLEKLRRERERIAGLERDLASQRLVAAVDGALARLTKAEAATYSPDASYETIAPLAREVVAATASALLDYPNEARLLYYKARGHELLGEEDAAVAAYSRAIELDPSDGRSWYGRGLIFLGRFQELLVSFSDEEQKRNLKEAREGWLPKARADLERAAARKGAGPGAPIEDERGAADVWMKFARRDYADAEAAASERIARGGRTEAFHLIRALAREVQGKTEEALSDYAAALDRHPGLWRARFFRGYVYRNLKRYDPALADFATAIRINPNYAVAYNYRGLVYFALQRYDEALADYSAALRINSNFAVAYNHRGLVYFALQRYDEALADYSAALRINSNFVEAYNNRGIVYDALQRYDEALLDYAAALRINPNYPEAYCNRGLVYNALQRYDEEIRDLESALRVAPPGWPQRAVVESDLSEARLRAKKETDY